MTHPIHNPHFDPTVRPDTMPSRRRLHILLVEDQLINQKIATLLLERLGHSVAVVDDGSKAIATLGSARFDVVFMDIQMPVMDGLTAIRILRESEALTGEHMPVFALTAHAIKGDRENCLEAGFDGYIAKPIRRADLLEAIETLEDTPRDIVGPELLSTSALNVVCGRPSELARMVYA
jgi:CheY-like chemotaxis protein